MSFEDFQVTFLDRLTIINREHYFNNSINTYKEGLTSLSKQTINKVSIT